MPSLFAQLTLVKEDLLSLLQPSYYICNAPVIGNGACFSVPGPVYSVQGLDAEGCKCAFYSDSNCKAFIFEITHDAPVLAGPDVRSLKCTK